MRRRFVWPLAAMTLVAGLLFLGVVPTRTWLAQRREISAEQQRVTILTRENQRLAARVSELHNDTEVERLAREQYNMVRPGEQAYAILPTPQPAADDATTPPTAAPPDKAKQSWWSRTWHKLFH